MARNNFIYSSFVSGELSPKFLGRTDTQQYNQGCEELRNFIVHPQGGVSRRPGTQFKYRIYKADGVSSPRQVRLIPFYATDGSRWQLILTDELVEALTLPPLALPVGAFDPATSAWRMYNVDTGELAAVVLADYSDGNTYFANYYNFSSTGLDINMNEIQYAQSGDTMILVHGKMRPLKVVFDPTLVSAAPEFGTKFYVEPFVRPAGAAKLTGAFGNWFYPTSYQSYGFNTEGQLFSDDPAGLTLQVTINIAGDSPDGGVNNASVLANGAYFTTAHIGKVYKLSHASKTLVIQIYAVSTNVLASARVIAGAINATPTTFGTNEIAQSSWDDVHGWPRTVGFLDERLFFGGTQYYPDKIWVSETDNVVNFETDKLQQDPTFADPIVATDPFVFTLKQNIYSAIRWMAPGQNMTVGTNAGEFIVKGPDQSQSIGPTNESNGVQTPHGSAYMQSVPYENTVVFLQRDRKSLREMVFNLDENSFIAPNLNIIGEHIANKFAQERADQDYARVINPGAFVALVKQEVPFATMWCLDNNGCLSGITRDRNQNVAAWHTHELAGDVTESGSLYKPFISSISAIQHSPLDDQGTGGEPDRLWLAVERRRADELASAFYLECLAQPWDRGPFHKNWDFGTGGAVKDIAPIYMDCAYFVDSDSVQDDIGTIASGITNALQPFQENDVVSVVMNGYYIGEFTVDDDQQIDISAYLTADQLSGVDRVQCIIGFLYVAKMVPVVAEVPATLGTSMNTMRRVDQVSLQLYRSLGVRYGRTSDAYQENTPIDDPEEIVFPQPSDANFSDPPTLFTGERTVIFPNGYDRRPLIMIESYQPYPCQVSFITSRLQANE